MIFFISVVISSVKFIAAKDAALIAVLGFILFITGAVAVTLSLLLLVKIHIGGKNIKGSSRVFGSSMDKKTKSDMPVDSRVQNDKVSRQHKNPKVHINIEMDGFSRGHAQIDGNGSDAKYSSNKGNRSCNVESHSPKTSSCNDSKFDKLVKNLFCGDTQNKGSCHDPI